jgi:hypothetical protein
MMAMSRGFLSARRAGFARPSHYLPVRQRFLLSFLITTAIGLFGPFAHRASATLFTLNDGNSSIDFDTSSSTNSSNWVVDGVNHLTSQAFWYRVGNAAEQPLNSVPHPNELASNTDFDPGLDTLTIQYDGVGFTVTVSYSLAGGAPGSLVAGMTENITINNNGIGNLDFHFFQYSDFDLLGTAGNDGAIFTNVNAVQQFDGNLALAETVTTIAPNHREIGGVPTIVNKLNDGVATTLSDTPPIGLPTLLPGNYSWAYQWDLLIPAGGSVHIGKAKNIAFVPEPCSALLGSLGALALFGARARRR